MVGGSVTSGRGHRGNTRPPAVAGATRWGNGAPVGRPEDGPAWPCYRRRGPRGRSPTPRFWASGAVRRPIGWSPAFTTASCRGSGDDERYVLRGADVRAPRGDLSVSPAGDGPAERRGRPLPG